MIISVWKKLLFTTLALLIFFTATELASRFFLPDKNDQPVIIERIMNTDIQHNWLETDPVLFWKLVGATPGETVFRVEDVPSGLVSELCQPDKEREVSSEARVPDPKSVKETAGAVEHSVRYGKNRKSVKVEAEVKSRQVKRLSAAVDRYMIKVVPPELPVGKHRIVCLGDSCTFFGQPSYPAVLEVLMNCHMPEGTWQVINAGVPAYSSLQGLKYLQTRLIDYHPSIISVYFGWNDHWLAHDGADAGYDPGHIPAPFTHIRRWFRFFDVLEQLSTRIRSGGEPAQWRGFRVSPAEYHANLTHMAINAQIQGISMVFLTAPHGFEPGNPPGYLLKMGYFDDLSLLIDTHNLYNDVVRRVASETGSALIDLASLIDARSDRYTLFLSDGIHLSDSGVRTVAEYVYRGLIGLSGSVRKVEMDI